MTKQEAIDLIKLRLGSREDTDLDLLLAGELSLSQTELEATAPFYWFCIKDSSGLATIAAQSWISLPSDFIIEIDEMVLEITFDGVAWVPLQKADRDNVISKYGVTPGQPEAYSLVGKKLHFGPIPDAVYSVRLTYQGRDVNISALAAGGTNEWLTEAADYLTAHTGLKAALWIKDSAAGQVFSGLLQAAKARLDTLQVAREEANRDRNMGDD